MATDSTIGDGYYCQHCGAFVLRSDYHACTTKITDFTWMWTSGKNPTERIAEALERIATALEKWGGTR